MFKKIFSGLFLITAITTANAYGNCNQNYETYKGSPSCNQPECGAESFNYVKLGGGFLAKGSSYSFGPSMGIGRRFQQGCRAIDLSMNWTGVSKNYLLTVPKIMYLHYMAPESNHSLYFGGGLSYGATKNKESRRNFEGLFGELAIGYEFHRFSDFRTFAELNLSQGMLPVGSKHHIPAPVLAIYAGVGF